jgi:hypothetical protein
VKRSCAGLAFMGAVALASSDAIAEPWAFGVDAGLSVQWFESNADASVTAMGPQATVSGQYRLSEDLHFVLRFGASWASSNVPHVASIEGRDTPGMLSFDALVFKPTIGVRWLALAGYLLEPSIEVGLGAAALVPINNEFLLSENLVVPNVDEDLGGAAPLGLLRLAVRAQVSDHVHLGAALAYEETFGLLGFRRAVNVLIGLLWIP